MIILFSTFSYFSGWELIESQEIEAENVLWHKIKPAWKMSGGGKSCSQGQDCLWVENSLQSKMSLQKIPQGGKCLEVQKAVTSVKK